MKRLLGIILSMLLAISLTCGSVLAAPTAFGGFESIEGSIPDGIGEILSSNAKPSAFGAPTAVSSIVSFEDDGAENNTPENAGMAFLASSLEGQGTEQSPFLISNADELSSFSEMINSETNVSAHFKLTNDIDLGGKEWVPVGYYTNISQYRAAFCGVFDGDGHTISNFKITNATTNYIGFFGYIYNGTVKNTNIDNITIDISTESRERLYVGGLVGRITAQGTGEIATILNCNVTNADISAKNKVHLCAGGIAGLGICDKTEDTEIRIYFSSFEGNLDLFSFATEPARSSSGKEEPQAITAGGAIGYLASDIGSSVRLKGITTDCDITADCSTTPFAAPFTGGIAGRLITKDQYSNDGGTAEIEGCVAKGTVTANAVSAAVAGGAIASLHLSPHEFIVKNCYSTVDCYVSSTRVYSAAGGFIGLLEFSETATFDKKGVTECYATGNLEDTLYSESSPPESSYVGGFVGYTYGGIFENCYKFAFQQEIGTDIFYDDITQLSEEEALVKSNYKGFDFEFDWDMNPDNDYPYPTLKEKTGYADFFNNGEYFAGTLITRDGKGIMPESTPKKDPTIEKIYIFSYWSLEENGLPFDFKNGTLENGSKLYAVYTETLRTYNITFKSEDETLDVIEHRYGSSVILPDAVPVKPETERFIYQFLHWSDAIGNTAFDFDSYTVSGNKTFYAVFLEIDKTAWEGAVADKFEYGTGSEVLPYVIASSEEFALFANLINTGAEGYTTAHYKLGDDINLGGLVWFPIGNEKFPFKGTFDGNGYTISNYRINPQNSKYAGLFGYVSAGVIKNVALKKFSIDYNFKGTASDRSYVGAVAGYIEAPFMSYSEISCVSVDSQGIKAHAENNQLFCGNIIGFGTSKSGGKLRISNCSTYGKITSENTLGQSFAGGIAGELETLSGGDSLIQFCYSIGDIDSKARRSSYAGGNVGYLYSIGSDFILPYGDSASLEADNDADLMLSGAFAISNISSHSEEFYSYIGRLVGSVGAYATYENLAYVKDGIILNPKEETEKIGFATTVYRLKDADFLSENLGFDFENIWTMTADSEYPVLSCTILRKPGLSIPIAIYSENNLEVVVDVLAKNVDYTVVFSVYNKNNQLIKLVRKNFESTSDINTLNLVFENLPGAHTVAASAVEKSSLTPIFQAVTKSLS